MTHRKQYHYMSMTWLLIACCTVLRLLYAGSFPLTPDETNYWQWSRYLAWGYHDQAPMIAWTIRGFTSFLGHTELAVRLPSIVSMTVASIYVVLIARHWFSAKIAWHTALFTQSVFIFNVGSLLATADGLQGAAWAASSYYVGRGFEHHRWRHWIAGGLCFGFGLLSKYTMVLFLPFVLAFGLLRCRDRLMAFRPYIGCALGLAMFVPVIYWNAVNDWNSIRHVAYLGGANDRFTIHLNYFAEYLGSQAGLVTPLAFGVICAGWVRVMRRSKHKHSKKWIYDYLLFTSLPMIAGFAFLSLHTRVYGNWPCAGYLTACVLAAALFSQHPKKEKTGQRQGLPKIWIWAVGSSYVLTLAVLLHVLVPILPIPVKLDRTAYELLGWSDLAETVTEIQNEMPDPRSTFVFGLRYQIASELAFYMPNNPRTVSINRWTRPNVYDYWWQDEDLLHKDAVGVMRYGDRREKLRDIFNRVDPPEPFHVYLSKNGRKHDQSDMLVKSLYVYRCYGFQGGLRWQPSNPNDIRVSSAGKPLR
jgi:undecaprenyl-diphosphatase